MISPQHNRPVANQTITSAIMMRRILHLATKLRNDDQDYQLQFRCQPLTYAKWMRSNSFGLPISDIELLFDGRSGMCLA